MGLPSSHSLRLIPCYGLRPRWTHITLPCPKVRTNGGVNAAFRHAEDVGFQDLRNFGAYNLHLSIVAWYPLPPASHQPVTRLGAGFSSEVVAGLSSGWIFTSWISMDLSRHSHIFRYYQIYKLTIVAKHHISFYPDIPVEHLHHISLNLVLFLG